VRRLLRGVNAASRCRLAWVCATYRVVPCGWLSQSAVASPPIYMDDLRCGRAPRRASTLVRPRDRTATTAGTRRTSCSTATASSFQPQPPLRSPVLSGDCFGRAVVRPTSYRLCPAGHDARPPSSGAWAQLNTRGAPVCDERLRHRRCVVACRSSDSPPRPTPLLRPATRPFRRSKGRRHKLIVFIRGALQRV